MAMDRSCRLAGLEVCEHAGWGGMGMRRLFYVLFFPNAVDLRLRESECFLLRWRCPRELRRTQDVSGTSARVVFQIRRGHVES